MKYKTLKAIFYSDHDQYENTYDSRYTSEDAVHLDMSIHGSPAFFVKTVGMMEDLAEIERLNAGIVGLIGKLPEIALDQFANMKLTDEVFFTNDIEGVKSTRREINSILMRAHDEKSRLRFFSIVNKYAMLREETDIPLKTCRDIRQLYDELVYEEVLREDPANALDGELFRKEPVYITNKQGTSYIHAGVDPEEKIIQELDKGLLFLGNSDVNILIRAAAFHFVFSYIHPFYDGNGRTDRFITSYILGKHLNKLMGYCLSRKIKEELSAYYNCFTECENEKNRGEITSFIIWFLEMIIEIEEELISELKEKKTKLDKYLAKLPEGEGVTAGFINKLYYHLLLGALYSEDGLSVDYLMEALDSSRGRLSAYLSESDAKGDLLIKIIGRKRFYKLNLEKF